ncbi:unnamed protein product [Cuscuta campestris]|uniref:TF-B3 domain-containing protein n=1 Tax=Cuscuta campestris TaxID=132261 RepID=A0A484LZ25_9ASTE|nr:unnamed protein product [Cuscuta campestris]
MKRSAPAKSQPENDEEVLRAAGNLVWMSRKPLGVEEAMNLLTLMKGKKKVLPGDRTEKKKNKNKKRPLREELPPPPSFSVKFMWPPPAGHSIDGTVLPRYPPNLEGVVDPAACGVPFEKQLTLSDLDDSQQRRLFMVKRHVERCFLPLLIDGEEDVDEGIPVTLYNAQGAEYETVFKRWVKNKYYVLNGRGWNAFQQRNGLKVISDWVTVWMFRHRRNGKLCFAITWKRMNTDRLLHYRPHKHRG